MVDVQQYFETYIFIYQRSYMHFSKLRLNEADKCSSSNVSLPNGFNTVYFSFWAIKISAAFYICRVNGVKLADIMFLLLCMCLCVLVHTLTSDEVGRPIYFNLQTSNLICMFPGTVWTWTLQNFWKGGVARVTWPPKIHLADVYALFEHLLIVLW